MQKKLTVPQTIAAVAAGVVLASALTAQICFRVMAMPARHRAASAALAISEELTPAEEEQWKLPGKLKTLYEYFEKNYVGQIDEEELRDAVLHSFVSFTGDRYAQYYTAGEYTALQNANDGLSVGIGIHAAADPQGRLFITFVEEDSPAAGAGLRRGDEIIAVGDSFVSDLGADRSMDLLRGEEGSEAVFTVLRDTQRHEYSLTRRVISGKSVRWQMEEKNVGYVRILSFQNNTFDEFKRALDELESAGAQALVFDLRSNGGGSLNAVYKMIDYLIDDLPEGESEKKRTLFTTRTADGKSKSYACSDGHGVSLPMAVLVNASTASAAELFTAALRDYGLAVTVGSRTYGKGVAQAMVTFKDGTALKLTTAYYDPPCNENYDGVGILPDRAAVSIDTNFNLLSPGEDPVYISAVEALGV